ncbi:hypothetical protein UAW_00825 [Enterococcus haemoperoxidus ATCC BAA-382]|uniref:Zinc-ribbon domain-containing protein n=1 Tax=Enterococcus haemoperoxidus ATCC BAA-382 TaxID=1158608 RepID=R2QT17_9ENTE|nr:zinc ribbon domain-containing protein [Enterococcus haemoperoxidus]EOH99672.1 hypothetical protein UAW_00825 [Enterococcus haemoperoxidus ATCC BAA-382]EOT62588.1 hypothetical protein I583_01588 [Enterococcus haemoperoxidus ATCC BAA-382]OJG55054.1 hypothetical protein RV06_GL002091 [Enterococcus haemoperoxidus]
MNYCIQCGKEIKKEANFCPLCGKCQIQESAEATSVETILKKGTQLQTSLNEQLKNNQTMQQVTTESKNYFSWLNNQIKGEEKGNVKKTQFFGVVNFFLLIILNALAISRSILRMSDYRNESPIALFIESLLLIGVYFFLFILVYFFASNKLGREKVSFLDSFHTLFSPVSITVYSSLIAFLFSFLPIDSYMIVMGLFCLSALLISLSFTDRLWKREDILGRFCLTLVIVSISFIIVFIIFKLVGGSKIIDVFIENLN